MKIAFDVDGVVLKSIGIILDYINKNTGMTLTSEDLFTWELERLGINDRMVWEAVEHMYAQPRIEPYEGAAHVLSRIHNFSDEPLLFITGRRDPSSALRQLRALPWNPCVPEIIVVGGERDKRQYLAETAAELIVEDDVEYLQAYLTQGVQVALMMQPWNRHSEVPVTVRFHGWSDVERWFLDLRHGSRDG
jgi:uncharacterized HAD superfamily protein